MCVCVDASEKKQRTNANISEYWSLHNANQIKLHQETKLNYHPMEGDRHMEEEEYR